MEWVFCVYWRARSSSASASIALGENMELGHANGVLLTSSPKGVQTACAICALRALCHPTGAQPGEGQPLVEHRRQVERGRPLFYAGRRPTALYAIRAGFAKTCTRTSDERERIADFHMIGDILGLDALLTDAHPTTVYALNGVDVCELPLDRVRDMAEEHPEAMAELLRILSEEYARLFALTVTLRALSAKQRVAWFLIDWSNRSAAKGYSRRHFHLHMRREEIGSYLGLTFETVSRSMSQLQKEGVIEVDGRSLHILNHNELQTIAAG
jgi:CRP/FNR family transcriptional regulator